MTDNRNHYFTNEKVINFHVLHHQCRGHLLHKSKKEHITVAKEDLKNIQKMEKKKIFAAVFRNKRYDLWLTGNLMIEHLKKS